MRYLLSILSLACCTFPALSNVEKTIFLAPAPIDIPQQHSSLDDLHLQVLSPSNPTLRRQVPAAFPKPEAIKGLGTWYLIEELREQNRYEVRLCWAATVSLTILLNMP